MFLEEADTIICMHARDAAVECSKALMININDTDIIVMAISVLPQSQELKIETMWTVFSQGAAMKWIPIHEVLVLISI